jgi:hypothetical protein
MLQPTHADIFDALELFAEQSYLLLVETNKRRRLTSEESYLLERAVHAANLSSAPSSAGGSACRR